MFSIPSKALLLYLDMFGLPKLQHVKMPLILNSAFIKIHNESYLNIEYVLRGQNA